MNSEELARGLRWNFVVELILVVQPAVLSSCGSEVVPQEEERGGGDGNCWVLHSVRDVPALPLCQEQDLWAQPGCPCAVGLLWGEVGPSSSLPRCY